MNDYFLRKYFAPDDFNMPFSTISPSSSDDKVCLVSLISLYGYETIAQINPSSNSYHNQRHILIMFLHVKT